MKTCNKIYPEIISFENLILAWKNARKKKTKKQYVIDFEDDLFHQLMALHYQLRYMTYKPKPLTTFIIRDPKTRKISKSRFPDRVIHHALVSVLENIFDKIFIYDSCANRKGKGNLFAVRRLEEYMKKVSRNGRRKGIFSNNQVHGYCLKADIYHYFEEVDHEILLALINKKITDEKVLWLIKQILGNSANFNTQRERVISWLAPKKGMPLGNYTSQFFANIYLNELDYFVKHKLKAKYYIRYVDDFVILHQSRNQLEIWKEEINSFLKYKLYLTLHPNKCRIFPFSEGIDFVGFRVFYHNKLLRKRNIRRMDQKISKFEKDAFPYSFLMKSFVGWQGHVRWANTFKLRKKYFKKNS